MDALDSDLSVVAAFDELKRRLDDLLDHPGHDNEATRHDRLIVPFLTHRLLLGWDYTDLVAQPSITTPSQLLDSHIFRESTPKSRKPDILVTSSAFEFNAMVVEEKKGQPTIGDLNGYRFQLHEYQALFECVWGLLTDGERWILKRGFESFHTVASLDELTVDLADIQHCIGKQNVVQRKLTHGTCDLVIIVPRQSVTIVEQSSDEPQIVPDDVKAEWDSLTRNQKMFIRPASFVGTQSACPDCRVPLEPAEILVEQTGDGGAIYEPEPGLVCPQCGIGYIHYSQSLLWRRPAQYVVKS